MDGRSTFHFRSRSIPKATTSVKVWGYERATISCIIAGKHVAAESSNPITHNGTMLVWYGRWSGGDTSCNAVLPLQHQ